MNCHPSRQHNAIRCSCLFGSLALALIGCERKEVRSIAVRPVLSIVAAPHSGPTDGYSGTIEPPEPSRNAGLLVEALPGPGGPVARQLIVVPRGPLRLRAALAHPFEAEANRLAIRLVCATGDQRVFGPKSC